LRNYISAQKLAGDIIHFAADGELLTKNKKKLAAAVSCLRDNYSSWYSKQTVRYVQSAK
jgi:hypothetical protein